MLSTKFKFFTADLFVRLEQVSHNRYPAVTRSAIVTHNVVLSKM